MADEAMQMLLAVGRLRATKTDEGYALSGVSHILKLQP